MVKKTDLSIIFALSLLFLLLSPGVILTLPPNKKETDSDCGIFFQLANGNNNCATSWYSVLVHTVVFGIISYVVVETISKNKIDLLNF